MKTYIMRDSKAVESQNHKPNPGTRPLTTAPEAPAPNPAPGPTLFIGLDVHNDTIAVSLAPSDSTELRRYGIIGGQHDDVLKLLKKLQAAHPDTVRLETARWNSTGNLPACFAGHCP